MRNAASLPRPLPSKFVIFDDFSGGMNTQSARQGLPEKQAAWIENLQPIAPNFLPTVQAPETPFADLSGEIVSVIQTVVLGTQTYSVAFCKSGAAYAVPVSGGVGLVTAAGATVQIAPSGTFSTHPDMAVWYGVNDRLLFADSVSGYATWDGTLFVSEGGVSPNIIVTDGGSGYTSGATVAITGGSGSGATAHAVVNGGVVTAVVLDNPGHGFIASDTLTVTITAVAAGSSATANAHVWPFVAKATTIAVAFSRVWQALGRTLIVTGTGSSTFGESYDDFLTADASVTTTIGDADLTIGVTALRYLDGYLYVVGDNSVKFIGGITVTSGITNFGITPLSSDQGTTFLNTVISYNRLVILANIVGVFAVFGASVQKISDAMDGIFKNIDFTQPLVCAVNDVNNIHTLLVLARYKDPIAGTRSVIMAYASQKWYLISQGSSVLAMATAILDGHADTFASSGSDLTQILQNATAPIDWKLQTSLTAHGDPIKDKRAVRAGLAQTAQANADTMLTVDTERGSQNTNIGPETLVLTFVNDSGEVLEFVNDQNQELTFALDGFMLSHSAAASNTGRYIGATATGTLNQGAIQGIFIEYQDGALWGRG